MVMVFTAVNCFGQMKDKFLIVDLIKKVINEVDHQNVVQIITDNAANCKGLESLLRVWFFTFIGYHMLLIFVILH